MIKVLLKFTVKLTIHTLALLLLSFQGSTVFAHSPHDPIALVELSPTYDEDKTVFMQLKYRLLKSTDGGYSWKQLVKGLEKSEKKSTATAIAISPLYGVDGTVFLSSQGGGIYKSIDRGLSWHLMSNELSNLRIQLLAISPDYAHEKMLIAVDKHGTVYKTIDGGRSFHKVHNGAQIKAITFSSELNEKFICMGDAEGVLYVSTDSGDTWQRRTQIPNSGGITSIAVSPSFTSDQTIVIGTTKGGVFKSLDGGTSIQKSTTGIPDKHIMSVAMSPNYEKDSNIFVSTWFALFGSNDRGRTWKKSSKGLTTDIQADELKTSHFRGLRISKTFDKDRTLFVGGFDGLFKSQDGGQSWIEVETLAAGNVQHFAFSPAYKDDHTIAISTFNGGVYITKDHGDNWEVRNRGLFRTHLMDIAISSNFASDRTIFANDNLRYYKSNDGGQYWQASEPLQFERCYWGWHLRKSVSYYLKRMGLPDGLLLTRSDRLCKMAIFPWVMTISPKFEADPTVFLGTRTQGILRSVDGGLNWSPAIIGQNGWVKSLAISPNFLSDRTLFAGVRDDGIYRTIDGGEIWKKVYDSKSYNIFVTISPYFTIDNTVFAGTAAGLIKTTDGGNSWEKVGDSCCGGNATIKALAISPNYQKDRTVIVSVKGSGLFKSEDGAGSFVEIGTELINKNHAMRLLEFSPAYETDKTIVGASYEELFLSIDAGQTWKLLKRPIRYEESVDYIRYEGKWVKIQNENFSTMGAMLSDVPKSKAKFNFVGSGIRWIGGKGNDHGIAKLYLDGKLKQSVNQFSSEQEFMVPVFSVGNLSEGPHSI